MKKHRILITTLLTCWFSFLFLITAVLARAYEINGIQSTGFQRLLRGESSHLLNANSKRRLNNDFVNEIPVVITRSTLPLEPHGPGLDIIVTLYDTIRLKGEIGYSFNNLIGNMDSNAVSRGALEDLGLHSTDRHTSDSEAKVTDFEATNANLDLEWVLPFRDTWRFTCGVGYFQETFQHEGRILGPNNSANDNYSPNGAVTSFETSYHMVYPLAGLEKQISPNTMISGVIKFPAYVWTEYEAGDPEVEQFYTDTNKPDGPTGTGFSGQLSLTHQFSENMFLMADLRYKILQAGSSTMPIGHSLEVDSMDRKEIGGMVKMGLTW